MPSKQLQDICELIENQNTDSFGKFYLYVGLLHKVTVQDKKTFSELMPTHKSTKFLLFKDDVHLNVGPLPYDFTRQVNSFSNKYTKEDYAPLTSAINIVSLYFRKGNLADLFEIIERMNGHLSVVSGNLTDGNQKIYNKLKFNNKQPAIKSFLGEISGFNRHLLSMADDSGNAFFSSVAALSGLILILATSFSILPLIIGMSLMIGGGISAYSYYESIKSSVSQTEAKIDDLIQKFGELPQDNSLFGDDKNYKSFISSIIQPIAYSPSTVLESVIMNEDMAKHASDLRNGMNSLSSLLGL